MNNKIRYCLALFLCVVWVQAYAASPRSVEEYFFNQTLGDFSEELELAREEGKSGILLMFEMDECPFCHRMKQLVLNQPDVQNYYQEHFIIFPVDIEGDVAMVDFSGKETTQKDFAFKQHRVRATPVFAFFDLNGQLITKYTGATANAEEFLWLGEYVVSGEYKKSSFSRYKRARKKANRQK